MTSQHLSTQQRQGLNERRTKHTRKCGNPLCVFVCGCENERKTRERDRETETERERERELEKTPLSLFPPPRTPMDPHGSHDVCVCVCIEFTVVSRCPSPFFVPRSRRQEHRHWRESERGHVESFVRSQPIFVSLCARKTHSHGLLPSFICTARILLRSAPICHLLSVFHPGSSSH